MIRTGTMVSISIYAIILGGLCGKNCADEAIVLFGNLGAMNVKFDIAIFNTMMNSMHMVRRRKKLTIWLLQYQPMGWYLMLLLMEL